MRFFQQRRIKYAFTMIALLMLPANCFSAMTSSSYRIDSDVISSGGDMSSSASYNLGDTLGETFIGPSSSASYEHGAGFWYAAADAQLALSCESPTVVMPDYQLGNANNYSQYTFSVTEECIVTDNSPMPWSLTVRSSNMTGPKNTVPNTNINLMTDGAVGTGTTITSPTSNLSETTGTNALDSAKTVVSGSNLANGQYNSRPTIRITNLNLLYAEQMTATITFDLL
jgi:hypothetical protein